MKEIYMDILEHKHHISAIHAPMSKAVRASKFSSYKALEGHEDKIIEEGRFTENRRILTEDEQNDLNNIMYSLLEREYEGIQLRVRYFKPDRKKKGGAYVEYVGEYRYYRHDTGCLVFKDSIEISIGSILELEEFSM